MGKFVAAIRVNEGIVVSCDNSTSLEQGKSIFKINEYNSLLLIDDIDAGIKFCKKYLKDFESQEGGFNSISKKIEEKLSKPDDEFKKKLITIALVGYEKYLAPQPFVAFLFDGDTVKKIKYDLVRPYMFSLDNTLGIYITSRTYSRLMSIQDTIRLISYITIQYQNILPLVLGNDLSIATITQKGFKQLTKEEITQTSRTTGLSDLNMKKEFIDLFIKESRR